MDIYDVVIIGGGPAGLTSAIYASRARMKALLIESYTTPAQAVLTSDIENYPGFPGKLTGLDLIDKFKRQAQDFGIKFKMGDVTGIKPCKEGGKNAWQVFMGGENITSLSVIIATGAKPKNIDVPGEEKLRGKGVSYCAICDGAFFKGKDVAVVGGGDTAIEEAIFLTEFANKVTVIHRRDALRATKILQERALANKKIEFIWKSVVTEIKGENKTEALRIKNLASGKEEDFLCGGVFVFIGYSPNTVFVRDIVKLDKDGYIVADCDTKTSARGIFAAGDVRTKLLRQIVTAAGDGATAAISARKYMEELKGIAYK